jgi:hypothetical protein
LNSFFFFYHDPLILKNMQIDFCIYKLYGKHAYEKKYCCTGSTFTRMIPLHCTID